MADVVLIEFSVQGLTVEGFQTSIKKFQPFIELFKHFKQLRIKHILRRLSVDILMLYFVTTYDLSFPF